MRVLKICATSGPSGLAVTSTVFSSAATAVRWRALGGRPQKTSASSSSFTPTPVFAEQQTMGISVPPATAWTINRRDFLVAGLDAVEVAGHHLFIDLDDRFDERGVDLVGIDQAPARLPAP